MTCGGKSALGSWVASCQIQHEIVLLLHFGERHHNQNLILLENKGRQNCFPRSKLVYRRSFSYKKSNFLHGSKILSSETFFLECDLIFRINNICVSQMLSIVFICLLSEYLPQRNSYIDNVTIFFKLSYHFIFSLNSPLYGLEANPFTNT